VAPWGPASMLAWRMSRRREMVSACVRSVTDLALFWVLELELVLVLVLVEDKIVWDREFQLD